MSSAAAVSFTAKLSHSKVEVGQRFQLTFTINSNGGQFRAPNFGNLRMLSGPNQSQSMQNINGRVSRTTSISYIFTAQEPGTVTINPATINVGNKTYKTKTLKLEVVKQDPNGANATRNNQNQRKKDGQEISDYTFMRAIVNKRSAYVGENVAVTFKIYSQLPIKQFMGMEKTPSLSGFWQQEIGDHKDLSLEEEVIDGVRYQTLEIQKLLLFPQRSGELTIDPMSVKLGVQVQTRRARTFWDQMMGSYELKEVTTSSKPITLTIKSLPTAGKPANFSGAVGNYTMKMTASKDSVESNEAIDIKVEVNGTGNIPLINAPKLNFPPDFEIYDPETKNNFSVSSTGVKGRKSFNYLVIPRHSGNFSLKPYSFSYFDLKSNSYKTIDADPINIAVAKGANEPEIAYSSSRKEDVELLNTDIRYIHLNGVSLFKMDEMFYGSVLFYVLLALIILIGIALYFYAKKFKTDRADVIGNRKSKANKLAKKRLAKAKRHLDAKENKAFYEEISAALFGYFADKFNISIAELSQEKIIELLPTAELKVETQTALEEAEMARFAPESSINPTILYEKSAEIIRKTENSIA